MLHCFGGLLAAGASRVGYAMNSVEVAEQWRVAGAQLDEEGGMSSRKLLGQFRELLRWE